MNRVGRGDPDRVDAAALAHGLDAFEDVHLRVVFLEGIQGVPTQIGDRGQLHPSGGGYMGQDLVPLVPDARDPHTHGVL